MSSIFLSHSSQDNAIAKEVKARLEEWGHRSVFLDFDPEYGIPAGRDWEKELYAKLRECRAVIILCSHASIASRWCFAEITHAKALGKPVFPIKLDDAQVDPVLTSVQVIDATAGWHQAYQRMEKGLLAAGLDPKGMFGWDGTRPPYPGLPAFQEEDAAIFFGRDKEIREGQALLNQLQQFGGPRLTLMLGASGSGKSSLMRAGLLPRLKRDQRWVVIEPFRPLTAPFDELALAIGRRFSPPRHVRGGSRWDEQEPKQSIDAFLELINELRETSGSREATVLLMIDQCEELLTGGANEEGDRFLAFLREMLAREKSRLMVLATLRSDFLGSFQDHPVIRGLRVETFPVPQMAVDDLASVIEGPAKRVGLELGPGLVQAMINDTKTTDALPLLAFTLRELYEGFGEDKLLTLEEYRDKLGRLDGCIERAADAVLKSKSLSEHELSDLRVAFLNMVRVADNDQYAKQPVLWNDLPVSTHEVLERFVTARLLVSSGEEKRRMLEVSHEALFRAWPMLADVWLKENQEFLVWQQRLKGAIKQYNEGKRNSDFLFSGFQLTKALEWRQKRPKSFSREEQEFVNASHRRRNQKRWINSVAIGLVATVVLAIAWLWQKGYTVDQAQLKVKSLFVGIHIEPDMVSLQGDTFQMLSLQNGIFQRGAGYPVTIKSFKLGKYEVTFDEYDRFAIATGRRLPEDQGWGRDLRPIINVSWEDAKAYAEWLSAQTGTRYRLPTEAEWEYAARGRTMNDEWSGTSRGSELEDYAVYYKNSGEKTQPVRGNGQRRPNDHGLYDMSGNVAEWVQDCYKGVRGEDCGQRVIHGGSWYDTEAILLSSRPLGVRAYYQGLDIGFRLAQDIEP